MQIHNLARYGAALLLAAATAFAPHAAGSPCQLSTNVSANGTVTENPTTPIALVSIDHFDSSTGAYKFTSSQLATVLISANESSGSSAGCGITATYQFNTPLVIFGGTGSAKQPLRLVNVAIQDNRAGRPLASYPYATAGTITVTLIDAATHQAQPPIVISVILAVTKEID
jgi:hypothetical protein